MRIRSRIAALCCSLVAMSLPATPRAEVILETATISGPQDRFSGPGFGVYQDQWYGARFTLAQAMRITALGTFVAGIRERRLFAALVALDSNGLPAFAPHRIESSALASVTFRTAGPDCSGISCIVGPSTDVLVPVSLRLEPGAYALVVGTGRFGADEAGGYWLAGLVPTPGTSLLSAHGSSEDGTPAVWEDGTRGAGDRFRFVVLGEPVPEPSSVALVGAGIAALLGHLAWRQRRRQ